jgi:hypothetical protein
MMMRSIRLLGASRILWATLVLVSSASSLRAEENVVAEEDPRIKKVVDAVKGTKSEEVLIISEPRTFKENILKYRRITIRPGGQIIFDNSAAEYFVIAAETLQFPQPDALALITFEATAVPELQGKDGGDGANGADGGGSGADGAAGQNGGNGTSGKTFQQKSLFLMVKNLEGPDGPLKPRDIRTLGLAIDTTGLRGGDGGRGGKGGYGGRGADGHVAKGGCPCRGGGGNGGNGGRGGNGGNGGDAGLGGNGGDVYLVGSEELTISMSYLDIQNKGGLPGRPGAGGSAGGPGVGGGMGRGKSCCGGGRSGVYGSPGSPGKAGKSSNQRGAAGKVYRVPVKAFEFLN